MLATMLPKRLGLVSAHWRTCWGGGGRALCPPSKLVLGVVGDVLLQAVAAEFAVEVTVLLMLMGAGRLEEEEDDVGATPLAQRAWAVLGATLGRALKLVSLVCEPGKSLDGCSFTSKGQCLHARRAHGRRYTKNAPTTTTSSPSSSEQ